MLCQLSMPLVMLRQLESEGEGGSPFKFVNSSLSICVLVAFGFV